MLITVAPAVKTTGPSSIPGVDETFHVYPISAVTSLTHYSASEVHIRRRFKDVVALSDLLQVAYPGYFIPPRPSRNAVEARRASSRFLEERRAGVERFLGRLAAHPALSRSEALQVFLEAPGDLRASAAWRKLQPSHKGMVGTTARLFKQIMFQEKNTPTPREVTQSAKASGDMLRLMRESIAQMQGALKAAPVDPLEQRLREETTRVEESRRLLAAVSARADDWVARSTDRQAVYADLSRALQGLAAYEEAFGYATGRPEAAMAEASAKIHKLLHLTSDHAAKHLAHLHDYLAFMPNAQAALQQRESALLTSLTLEADLSRRRSKLEAFRAAGEGGCYKAIILQQEVPAVEESLAAARSEYHKISDRNAEEVESLTLSMRSDMVAMVREFALVQVASCQKAAQLWGEAAAALGSPEGLQLSQMYS